MEKGSFSNSIATKRARNYSIQDDGGKQARSRRKLVIEQKKKFTIRERQVKETSNSVGTLNHVVHETSSVAPALCPLSDITNFSQSRCFGERFNSNYTRTAQLLPAEVQNMETNESVVINSTGVPEYLQKSTPIINQSEPIPTTNCQEIAHDPIHHGDGGKQARLRRKLVMEQKRKSAIKGKQIKQTSNNLGTPNQVVHETSSVAPTLCPLSDITNVFQTRRFGERLDSNYTRTTQSLPAEIQNMEINESVVINSTGVSGFINQTEPVSTTIYQETTPDPIHHVNEDMFDDVEPTSREYWDIGDPTCKCQFCGAFFWYDERLGARTKTKNPKYSRCCMHGKIQLPPMKEPPEVLHGLLNENSEKSKHFLKNIRSYNSMFSFTSMGGKIDHMTSHSSGPPVFRLHGQNYHLMGSLLPIEGAIPKFAQLYIYDTENEIHNRIRSVRQRENINTFHAEIVSDLKEMLDEHNILVKTFRMARDFLVGGEPSNVKLRLIGRRGGDARRYNLPTASEVAALVVGDFDECLGDRDIVVETRSGLLQRINELNAAYLALQYPLLFPYGEDGYREDIPFSTDTSTTEGGRTKVSVREWFAYRLHQREHEPPSILVSGRLTQQFVVDAYTMVESARLTYVRTHQIQLRCEMYKGLAEALLRGENDPCALGRRVILPSTFTGGARYMIQNYQDAMAICRWAGYPDLFITFTCNPKWPEIVRYLEKNRCKAEDRPDIICRVFKMKLDGLIRDLRKNKIFGTVRALVYTVEFQKRGLPHAHILLFLDSGDKYPTPDDIDRIISAEIPDQHNDPDYYNAVKDFMMHGPCGFARPNSPCMSENRCTKHFPKNFIETTIVDEEGYPVYRRRNDGRIVVKNGIDLDNRFVVPHNRYLLMKYGAHLNVEWCNQSRSIKYLFKYVNKGHDRVTASFYRSAGEDGTTSNVDEINMYYDCRYISPCEAMWRILGFEIQYRNPPVERLSFHLPNEQSVIFSDSDSVDAVLQRPLVNESMFLAWFKANRESEWARQWTYAEFPQHFVWKASKREWVQRERGFSLGRIFYVPPGSGEIYYLRCLLNVVRGCTSFDDIKTVDGVRYATFRDACYAYGLLDDDKEYSDGILEASQWASAQSLRHLFATLLSSDCLNRPEVVWEKCWAYLSEDVLYRQRKLLNHQDLSLTEDEIKNLALVEIESIMRKFGKSLRDYETMPFPDMTSASSMQNKLVHEELRYDRAALTEEHTHFVANLTDEQRHVYDTIIDAVDSSHGGVFFVYGYGGTGKTFLWRTLSAAVRSKGEIVLNVASSGIASLLLPGGRTAHSRFSIPLNPNENSTCSIRQGSQLAELIVRAKLIIWDEAPMMHRYCFEALDRTLQDIMQLSNPVNKNKPFGGKTIVFGGDFRQILPVIPKGTRQDIVHATINSSNIWKHCKLLRLTKNMRLQAQGSTTEYNELKEFSEWIASIGDGTLGVQSDDHADVEIPADLVLESTGDPILSIVQSTYPSYMDSRDDPSFLQDRAILAPTLDVVDGVNEYMSNLNSGEAKTYLSSDSVCRSDANVDVLADVHTPEFLNSIKCSGVPNHELKLKVGTPVMLLRNIDHSLGLCNGTRLVITKLGSHVLEAKIMGGNNAGHRVLLPRMSLTPSDPRLPFKFQRRQFPLIVSYAMTINKSQGQSLSHVGLLLKKPVFSHGQLYVAVSRVTNRKGLKILICDQDGNSSRSTKNVVYKEVFQNL